MHVSHQRGGERTAGFAPAFSDREEERVKGRLVLKARQAQALRRAIATKCVEISTLFEDRVQVTCVIRVPGDPNGDVVVSAEPDFDEVIAVVERSKERDLLLSERWQGRES